jgi:predicted metal-binding protein
MPAMLVEHKAHPPRILPGAQPVSSHFVMVCRTCPRFVDGKTWLGETQGQRLAHSISVLWPDWALATHFRLRVLTCLGGCPNPCNVALSGPGKWRLRIKRVAPCDAAALLELASTYLAHVDGNMDDADLPESVRQRIGARTPPYAAPSASVSDAIRTSA